jgi:hypothetical protein
MGTSTVGGDEKKRGVGSTCPTRIAVEAAPSSGNAGEVVKLKNPLAFWRDLPVTVHPHTPTERF